MLSGSSDASAPFSFNMLVYRMRLFFDRLRRRQNKTDTAIAAVLIIVVAVVLIALLFGAVVRRHHAQHVPDVILLEDGLPKGDMHPPTDVAIDANIELPILTIASRDKMNELREFVGSVHRFCPKCPVHIYSYSLFSDQLLEIAQWDNVHVIDVFNTLLLHLDPSSAINPVQLAIQHAFTLNNKILYLDVNHVLTEGLTDLDKLIEKERLVLVKHDTSLGGSDDMHQYASQNVQGYFRFPSTPFVASEAAALVAEAKNAPFNAQTLAHRPARFLASSTSPEACFSDTSMCVTHGAIRPAEFDVVPFQLMKNMPFVHQSLKDTLVELRIAADATATVCESIRPKKAELLQTLGQDCFGYLRFDLGSITGNIVSARFHVHTASFSSRNAHPATSVRFVPLNTWAEDTIVFSDRPVPESETALLTFSPTIGQEAVIDISTLAPKFLERISVQKRVSLMLNDLDNEVEIDYHSRHASDDSKHPLLVLKVRGQGIYHTYLRTSKQQ